MPRRSSRLGFLHPEQEVEKLREARRMLVCVCMEYPINGEAYRRAGQARAAIDDVADVLVGDRTYLWRKD